MVHCIIAVFATTFKQKNAIGIFFYCFSEFDYEFMWEDATLTDKCLRIAKFFRMLGARRIASGMYVFYVPR